MRARSPHASRASNGALRAVRAGDDQPDDETGARVEPFEDVSESGGAPYDAQAHGMNGHGGAHVASKSQSAPQRQPLQETDQEARHEAHHEPLGPDDPLAPLPFNPYKGNRGLTRAWHAMKNSLAGFRVAIREESAFRQELTLAAILLPCGVLVPVEPVSRVLLLGSVLLVLIVELLNSSLEAAIDRISLERHELSRRAKDLGSAAVMVALGMCVMTWALIVGPLVVHWVKAWL
ncbi:diacylglycerol kinase [Paraburkholderia sp. MPAMCS5]|uniref:diacylglycerol kinase n=1 Tax=Paraburkholderia sp. MPAMCS5 TaxID=3112563 RepID=UPI002E16E987|nr:diacylglycerol kinase [Paraburkholderia sp. MPAMCS5]